MLCRRSTTIYVSLMKRGELVKIVASDGHAIGTGIYLGERWYDVFETFASYVYFTEGSGWKFSHFEEPWWRLEIIEGE